MLHTLPLFALLTDPSGPAYDGSRRELDVRVPRVEAEVIVDGRLDEEVWARAARLTGFSQYAPTDGVPAADSTEILVWYSPTAIHFGIRAFEAHGAVHATLAERDRIDADDYVQIFLGTFGDGRQATVLAVNPLGVQSDGTLVETGKVQGTGFNASVMTRELPDLSPDFVFASKGAITPFGYEVEVSVPFKSLRFQPAREQSWHINVLRRVQHSGAEDSWTPALRSRASFLAQSGALRGLADLRRGRVLEVTPELTHRTEGAPSGDGWRYEAGRPDLGGNLRWGVTNNLTLNGTVNPDFSQVEADAGQVSPDPRFALSVPEKRPFFLDGIEQFSVPSSLIYTRRIIQPVAAAKVAGKVSGTDVAFLSAVDDRGASLSGDAHPVFNILRVQRDVGGQSRLGLAYTDRIDGDDYNRVADVDGRFVLGDIYTAQFQLAGSATRRADAVAYGPLWDVRLNRSGRVLGARYRFNAVGSDFVTQSGFLSRRGISHASAVHSLTRHGGPSDFLQSLTGDVTLDGTWQYDRFLDGRDMQDKKLHLNLNGTLRGGWQVGGSLLFESFGFEPADYAGYAVERRLAGGVVDTVPFEGTPRLKNFDYVLSLTTPDFQHLSATTLVIWGRDVNFPEWASGNIIYAETSADWRPTGQARVQASWLHQQVNRPSDGSRVEMHTIPRLKLEYQLTRALFVRLVGEYDVQMRDSLRDDGGTGAPILVRDEITGGFARPAPLRANAFRGDWLVSYQPTPGTLMYVGYTSTRTEPDALRFERLRRTSDGFFVKASWLLRL